MFALEEGFVSEWQPSEQAFRGILSGLNEALFIYDESGKLLYLNAAALDRAYRYLYPFEVDREPLELYQLDGEPVVSEQHPLRRALRGETFSDLELRLIDPSSQRRRLHSCSAWIVEQETTLCVLKATDTTERREAEERFSVCFSENPIPTIVIALKDFCVIDVNQSFLDITGFDKHEVVDAVFTDMELFADTEEKEDLLKHFADAPGERSANEFKLQSRSGQVLNVLIQSRPIQLYGEPCLLGTLVDVTDRKRTEEQLMRAIQEVMNDTAWFSRSVMEKLAQIRSDADGDTQSVSLTKRERQLLELIAKGLDDAQIQEEMGLAKTTVRNYTARVYSKLGVHSRAEAIVWARERGVVA